MVCTGGWRGLLVGVALCALGSLAARGAAQPPAALGPNEALVCSKGFSGVISVLDLTTGRLRELPGTPVALLPPLLMPGRNSFLYWQAAPTGPTLWLATLPHTSRRLYTAPPDHQPMAAVWWQAHYCALTCLRVGDDGWLLMVTPQGVSRELQAKLDQGAGNPELELGFCESLVGLADGTHALTSGVAQAVRASVDVNTGRGVFLGGDWEHLPTLAWPWQANLHLQAPQLNPADGRIYGTLLAYAWTDAGIRTPELQADFRQALARASGVYSFQPDGSDLRRVSVPPSMGIGTQRFPALVDLSPDGRRLLFTYYDYGVKGYTVPGLYICNLDGSGSRAVPGEGTKLSTAVWGS